MYVPVPTTPPQPPSAEAQELGGHLARLIQAYQADHPEMSPLEVRQAVQIARQAVGVGGPSTKILIKAIVLGLVMFGGFAFYFLQRAAGGAQIPFVMISIGILAVVALGLGVIATNRQ